MRKTWGAFGALSERSRKLEAAKALLIRSSNEASRTVLDEQQAVMLLCGHSINQRVFENPGVLVVSVGQEISDALRKALDDGSIDPLDSPQELVRDGRDTAFAVYQKERRRLILLADPLGLNLLYYKVRDRCLTFSSEMKTLLVDDEEGGTKLNFGALAEYLCVHQVGSNETLIAGVNVLPPGSYLAIDPESTTPTIHEYYRFTPEDVRGGLDEVAQRVRDAVTASIANTPCKNASFLLSGGMDSRVLLACMDEETRRSLTCINFGTRQIDDVRFARKVAEKLRLRYDFVEITPQTILDNMEKHIWITEGNSNHFNSYLHRVIPSTASEGVIDGVEGAFLSGLTLARCTDPNPEAVFIRMCLNRRDMDLALGEELCRRVREAFHERFLHQMDSLDWLKDPYQRMEVYILLYRVRLFTNFGSLTACEYSRPLRPFLNSNLVEFIIGIPREYRRRGLIRNLVVKRFFPELADIPSTTNYRGPIDSLMPLRMRRQKIVAHLHNLFETITGNTVRASNHCAPIDEWLRTDKAYRQAILDLLLGERTLRRGYFNEPGLRKLLEEHDRRKENHAKLFSYLVDLELFLRLFVDGDGFHRSWS